MNREELEMLIATADCNEARRTPADRLKERVDRADDNISRREFVRLGVLRHPGAESRKD